MPVVNLCILIISDCKIDPQCSIIFDKEPIHLLPAQHYHPTMCPDIFFLLIQKLGRWDLSTDFNSKASVIGDLIIHGPWCVCVCVCLLYNFFWMGAGLNWRGITSLWARVPIWGRASLSLVKAPLDKNSLGPNSSWTAVPWTFISLDNRILGQLYHGQMYQNWP